MLHDDERGVNGTFDSSRVQIGGCTPRETTSSGTRTTTSRRCESSRRPPPCASWPACMARRRHQSDAAQVVSARNRSWWSPTADRWPPRSTRTSGAGLGQLPALFGSDQRLQGCRVPGQPVPVVTRKFDTIVMDEARSRVPALQLHPDAERAGERRDPSSTSCRRGPHTLWTRHWMRPSSRTSWTTSAASSRSRRSVRNRHVRPQPRRHDHVV
jgi:hypothetical protein